MAIKGGDLNSVILANMGASIGLEGSKRMLEMKRSEASLGSKGPGGIDRFALWGAWWWSLGVSCVHWLDGLVEKSFVGGVSGDHRHSWMV